MKNVTAIQVWAGALIGCALGVCGFTFVYARGHSYFTNNPAACANCHVMEQQFSAWVKSSHRNVAVCNDCHTPPGLVHKYITKAQNGFMHSFAFTTGNYTDPLQIKARNHAVSEKACRKCHQEMVAAIESPVQTAEQLSCIRCHPAVGHMTR